jgi:HSP20 family molecular chaperone IbpA
METWNDNVAMAGNPRGTRSLEDELERLATLGATDVIETDRELILKADAPGLRKGDIEVLLLKDNIISIRGERKRCVGTLLKISLQRATLGSHRLCVCVVCVCVCGVCVCVRVCVCVCVW